MKGLGGLLKYVKNYKSLIGLNIVFNILVAIFSVISIPALTPILNMLAGQTKLVHEPPTSLSSKDDIIQFLYYHLSQIIIENGAQRAMAYICLIFVVIFFFKNFFRYLSAYVMAPVRNGIIRDLRKALFDKSLNLPLSYFSEQRKGDLISRITADVQEIEWSILNVLEIVFREPLLILGALIMMILISPSLTLFVLVLILFTALVIGGIGKVLRAQSGEVQSRLGNIVSLLEETLSGMKVIKGFNAESYQSKKFDSENESYKRLLTKLLRRRDLSSPLSEFLGMATVCVLLWYGFSEVLDNKITFGSFLTFLYAFFSIIAPVKSFSKAYYNVQKGLAASDRIEEILEADISIKDIENPKSIQQLESNIEYKNVSFAYNEVENDVLQNINFTLKKGQTIALVGPSGGGKTTIVDLLPRFYEVTQGQIKIDGVDIRNYALNDLRSLFGIVTQDAFLFNDSIYNNIVFGLKNKSKEDVIQAAKIANAHDFILEMGDGYETNVGDRGSKLSGGQRQRITIARAILKDPEILILDEATSALDSEAEKLVQDALVQLLKNRTSIVIAHRLSTVQDADEILVLKSGMIVERGNHQELMSMEGDYKKLVELQMV